MAVAPARWRPYGDEHRISPLNGLGGVDGEGQAPRGDIVRHQLVESGLENGNFARLQPLDLARILVDAGHHMAEIGEAGAGDQPHIA